MLQFVNTTIELYPSPKGILRGALQENLKSFYTVFAFANCTEIVPF